MSEILKPTPEQLAAILANHKKWQFGEAGGKIANLRSADLSGANLRSANLKDIKGGELILAQTEIIPREGEVIGWKKCRDKVLVKLRVPADAKRSNAPGGRKCRAERAEVLEIIGPMGGARKDAVSLYDSNFIYCIGEVVTPGTWNTDRFTECGSGIHFYLTREEAEAHE